MKINPFPGVGHSHTGRAAGARPRLEGRRVWPRVLLVPLLLAVCAAALALPSTPAHATGFLVTKTADTMDGVCDADCSLREAIWAANQVQGPHTIDIPGGGAVYQLTIPGTAENAGLTGDLDISNDVEIFGDENPIIQIDGQQLGDRVIHVISGTVVIAGVTIQGGVEFSDDGGGILNQSSLTLWNSTVNSNLANRGGGIANWGTLTLENSTVSSNAANSGGGGLYNGGTLTLNGSAVSGNIGFGASGGGGLYNGGTLTMNSSTVNGNTAYLGGGIADAGGGVTLTGSTISDNEALYSGVGSGLGGGISFQGGTHTLNNTTVTNNTVGGGGGGVFVMNSTVTLNDSIVSSNYGFNSGGGIYSIDSTLDVVRSSIFANSAAFGGGINNDGNATVTNSTISGNGAEAYGGGVMNNGFTSFTNSTLSGNSAATGGGIYNWPGPNIDVQTRNTMVVNSPSGSNCAGDPFISYGYNLSSDSTCASIGPGDINNAWPALGPLAYNGGPTPTHALLEGSPAADGAGPGCPATDQRGIARPQGLRCDIGAFEAPDSDADGVADPADTDDDNDGFADGSENPTCRTLPEDYDAFQDTDGCPEPDNDGDGVCDAGQTSVSCAGSDSGKPCFDPAGTLSCPTTDCRNLAEDFDAFKDTDGCPEPDNDNDGKLDAADVCPGTNAHAGADGMLGSPQDLNHNGVKDVSEAAFTTDDSVLVFEDYDGVLDADGCHDSPGDDFDGDGFTDDIEALAIGTNPGRGCAATATANDEDPDPFPSDADDNQKVNIGDVIILFSGKVLNPPAYTPRSDFDDNGTVNIGDVIIGFNVKAHIFDECQPGS
jgi:CSLREA domain-containing protein